MYFVFYCKNHKYLIIIQQFEEVNNLLTLPRKDNQSLEDRIQANIESLENELK